MFPIQDQLSVVTKTNFEMQFATLTALTNKTFESVEKLFDLNRNLVKASLEESAAITRQFMAAKDPQEFFSIVAAQTQPNAEKALSYGRHLAGIASSTQAEFTKAAEVQIAETTRKVTKLVEDAAKNAPAGSENVVSVIKSAIGNAQAGYEQLSKTAKQATAALEANLNAAATQIVVAVEKSSSVGK